MELAARSNQIATGEKEQERVKEKERLSLRKGQKGREQRGKDRKPLRMNHEKQTDCDRTKKKSVEQVRPLQEEFTQK